MQGGRRRVTHAGGGREDGGESHMRHGRPRGGLVNDGREELFLGYGLCTYAALASVSCYVREVMYGFFA